MTQYVHLIGAEEVTRAAASMAQTAHDQQRAAGTMAEAVADLGRHVERFESGVAALGALAAEGQGEREWALARAARDLLLRGAVQSVDWTPGPPPPEFRDGHMWAWCYYDGQWSAQLVEMGAGTLWPSNATHWALVRRPEGPG